MSKCGCPCGWVISDVGFPSAWKAILRPQLDEDEDGSLDLDIWECTECGRIAIEMPSYHLIWFKPENGKYNAVCSDKPKDPSTPSKGEPK